MSRACLVVYVSVHSDSNTTYQRKKMHSIIQVKVAVPLNIGRSPVFATFESIGRIENTKQAKHALCLHDLEGKA